MKLAQKWRCDVCGEEYKAPLPIKEAYCSKTHPNPKGRGRAGHPQMALIEGQPVKNRTKKESPRGKSGSL